MIFPLGIPGPKRVHYIEFHCIFHTHAHVGAGTTAFKAKEGIKHWLDNINCEGDEENLFACNHTPIDGDECNKGLRAGVICFGPL